MDLTEFYALSRHYLENKFQPYHRHLLKSNFFDHRLSIILGQRGVGKTTLIIQYLRNQTQQNILTSKILYIPCDHFLLSNTSLYKIADHFQKLGGEILAFDEIHKYASWSKELKSIYDTFPELHVIASGSSALAVYKGTHDLTRRAIVHEIVGLSYREYLELNHGISLTSYSLPNICQQHELICQKIVAELKPQKLKILSEFKQYLQAGYYPYAREISDLTLYWMTLEQNIHTTLDSDLSAVFPTLTGSTLRKLKQLLGFISTSVPFSPNLQKLKQLLHIGDERTLKNYFKYLEDARLIRQLKSASSKLQQLEIPEKIYLDNPNQLYAISKATQNIGTVRELFFLTMVAYEHQVTAPKRGDFLVDKMLFEIGGKNKEPPTVSKKQTLYLACDDIEHGVGSRIPLWLFGFLY